MSDLASIICAGCQKRPIGKNALSGTTLCGVCATASGGDPLRKRKSVSSLTPRKRGRPLKGNSARKPSSVRIEPAVSARFKESGIELADLIHKVDAGDVDAVFALIDMHRRRHAA